ncbi:alpha/beta hydrolase [Umboniibacter marinipuniceus]|uniref:Alpha-beta hydrolase superfamily lysophospholipase n=1 Tax=Umboniibacter marinipuniceus TaxID=569599 RepID=A0A3M0A4W4_9GAMM|nr:alpha/beta hydrolase [Umboniibacter marinipuniceus]RMA79424.1 alpha-beta hydrolase superfamily lysophospholipase [Umboniibacter marinipuniceus]
MSLYHARWQAEKPVSQLLIVHGVGEHIHRYEALAKKLNQAGISVYGFDQLGHGRSEGARGHINSWRDYRDPVEATVKALKDESDLPLFVWGHSMGSLVVLDWWLSSTQTINGLVVSGTLLAAKASWWRIAAAKLLSSITPKLSLPLGLSAEEISTQKEVVSDYLADPLVHGIVSARWGNELLKTLAEVNTQLSLIDVPTLIGHGADDAINEVESSYRLSSSVAGQKQLEVYPGVRHEVHNDSSREHWQEQLVNWCTRAHK